MASKGKGDATQHCEAPAAEQSISAKVRQALASIDRQAPGLTYMGIGCWNAWNTIAFSGAFWLHETDNSSVTATLMMTHLLACIATLLVCALASRRAPLVFAKNRTTFAGALVASVGTLVICCARQEILPFDDLSTVFRPGCVLSGVGTTLVFFRGATLFSTLPPHRTLYRLAEAVMFSAMIFLMLSACPNELATACFVLLPIAGACLFAVRSRSVGGERRVLTQTTPVSGKFATLLVSIALCSMALELIRAYILVTMPPTYSVGSITTAQLIIASLMVVILAAILLARSQRDSFARIYSTATGVLVLLLVAIAMFSWHSTIVASIASVTCTCFNLIVWAMLFYLVFQAKANAILVVGLGNAALSAGTVVANLLTLGYLNAGIDADTMRVILAVLGIAVLFDVLFVFSEKQIDAMLLPVDETAGEDVALPQKQPGKWKLACERLAAEGGLSERETEVFMQLARGRTAQEIADREVLSIYTVRAHTRSIYAKLDVHSKKELGDRIAELAK